MEILVFERGRVTLSTNFRRNGGRPPTTVGIRKLRVPGLSHYIRSVLLHCWLGHLNCKIVSEMTYNVSTGTLNLTIPYVSLFA